MMGPAYCCVVTRAYLPTAIALGRGIAAADTGAEFFALVVDDVMGSSELATPEVTILMPHDVGLSQLELEQLGAIYSAGELCWALKPLVLMHLLRDHQAAIYLDTDILLVSALAELEPLLSTHGVVVTPHLLRPVEHGESFVNDASFFNVGTYQAGFIAVSREGQPFLRWWWSRLRRDCIEYPLLGYFGDQKWLDIGVPFFNVHVLRHPGYNVGPWNVHERTISGSLDELQVGPTGAPLRFYHFSGLDISRPHDVSDKHLVAGGDDHFSSAAYVQLRDQYVAHQREAQTQFGRPGKYRFAADLEGRHLTTRLRRAYRAALLSADSAERSEELPSPFDPDHLSAWRKWRRRSWSRRIGLFFTDSVLASKYILPDEFSWVWRRFPKLLRRVRSRFVGILGEN